MWRVDLRRNFVVKNLWVVIALCLALHHPQFASAAPLNFTGSWHYSETGGDVEEAWSFQQSYNLTGSKDLSEGMDLTANMRYSETESESEEDDSTQLAPSASYDIQNDLFLLNFNASQNERRASDRPTFTNESWNVNWMSRWKKLWPQLRMNYGQSFNRNDESPRTLDNQSSNFSSDIDYDWRILRMRYGYRTSSSEDNLTGTTSSNFQHTGQARLNKSFFDNRFSVSADQSFTLSESETDRVLTIGDTFFSEVSISAAYSGIDDTPLYGALSLNDALNDGFTDVSAGVEIVPGADALNLGMKLDLQPVDQIRVHLDREISPTTQALLEWEVYQSSDGASWELIDQIPAIIYDMDLDHTVVRIEIPAPELTVRYLKAVVKLNPGALEQPSVTEIQAGRFRVATAARETDTTKNRNLQSRMSMNYRPNSKFSLGYNVRYATSEPDPGVDSWQLTHSVNGNYIFNKYVSTSMAVNENRDTAEAEAERLSRSYSMSVHLSPLRTLDASVGYTRSENFEDTERQSVTDTLSSNVSAEIYRDLSAGLTTQWSQAQNDETGADSTSLGWRLNSTARLNPKVTGNVFYEYNQSDSEAVIEDETAASLSNRYGGGVGWRPSDILSVNAAVSRDQEEGTTPLSGAVSWRVTPKIQTSAQTSFDLESFETQNYSASLNWSVSDYFSLRSAYSYVISDIVDSWSWSATLNASF